MNLTFGRADCNRMKGSLPPSLTQTGIKALAAEAATY